MFAFCPIFDFKTKKFSENILIFRLGRQTVLIIAIGLFSIMESFNALLQTTFCALTKNVQKILLVAILNTDQGSSG